MEKQAKPADSKKFIPLFIEPRISRSTSMLGVNWHQAHVAIYIALLGLKQGYPLYPMP